MTHKIAVVEDDELIRDMIRMHLEREGFQVLGFPAAEPFLNAARSEAFDLLILDIVLPGMPGDSLLQKLRLDGIDTPVLILTVKDDLPARLRAFDRGADDHLAKPFDLDELTARIRAILLRSQGLRHIPSSEILIVGGCRVNISTRMSESGQGEVLLSEKEIRLLLYLSRHARQNLSRTDILEEVWGMQVAPTPRTVDNFILKFRKLYEKTPDKPRHFLSVRGRGYRFEP